MSKHMIIIFVIIILIKQWCLISYFITVTQTDHTPPFVQNCHDMCANSLCKWNCNITVKKDIIIIFFKTSWSMIKLSIVIGSLYGPNQHITRIRYTVHHLQINNLIAQKMPESHLKTSVDRQNTEVFQTLLNAMTNEVSIYMKEFIHVYEL